MGMSLQHFTTHKYLHAYENEMNKILKPKAKLKNRKQFQLLKYYEF